MNYKHGHYLGHVATPEMRSFEHAKSRCTNKNSDRWPFYGGRGIKFLFKDFQEFLAALGPRPSLRHSVERINNDGHYEPGNVRWATKKEQAANRRLRRDSRVRRPA